MTSFNYRWHRSRLKIPMQKEHPGRGWVTVKKAAWIKGVSETTIRTWYLKKIIPAICLESQGKLILVKIS